MNTSGSSRVGSPAGIPVVNSSRVTKAMIEPVLSHAERVRNVCILAHVDHGKTTLTDTLLASNGIISFKQAGKLRYMDSREDEQERGITMQASAITLLCDVPSDSGQVERHAINLIDSPGHVDFSRQVVTAARLCDGCLVLIDAVEGVCTQTLAVLRQAKRERLTPCLVINKIDKLITELRMSTTDVTTRLQNLLEQVNAVQATMQNINEDEKVINSLAEPFSPDIICQKEETIDTFDPLKGNVVFASSTDGWAFTIENFVQLYSQKLDMKAAALRQTLWGQHYFEPKGKRVLPKKAAESLGLTKTMFAHFILEAIWAVYEATVLGWSEERIEKIAKQTGAKVPARELRSRDGRGILRALMGHWLPLAETIFGVITRHIPSPLEANHIRLASLIKLNGQLSPASQRIVEHLVVPEKQDSAPMVAFVSKFFSVKMRLGRISLEANSDISPSSAEEQDESSLTLSSSPDSTTEKLIGMARMFHGTLSVGDTAYILGSKHQPGRQIQATAVVVREIYLLMGRDLEMVERVHAGSIFGIGGIAHLAVKSATLSSTPDCPLLETPRGEVVPIVQVAIRPTQLDHLDDLAAGLKILCQADPCAETFLQEENGEHILATAGELHLEQCLKDLRERYTRAGTDFIVSPPMVPYRETITNMRGRNEELWRVHVGFDDIVREVDGLIMLQTTDGRCRLGVRALPIPESVLSYIINHRGVLRDAFADRLDHKEKVEVQNSFQAILGNSPGDFWSSLRLRHIWTLGPRRDGSNMLICVTHLLNSKEDGNDYPFFAPNAELRHFQSSILTGFQLVTEKGPLAHEPMMGVAYVIEKFELVNPTRTDQEGEDRCRVQAQISSQLIPLARTLFETAYLFWSPRLMLAIYACSIQTTAEMSGRVHVALAKRHGRTISEEYHAGTGFFTINARLPVAESFGFADDLRGRTAGVAIPQLVFAGFETLPEDPYWIPTTLEELEDYGTINNEVTENLAMRYLVRIRERKGLFVERKIVQFAEKQRTLKK